MLVGDVQKWADSFISLDDRLLKRISVVWPACMSVLPNQPEENDITINLVDRLTKDAVVRRLCHWVEYQFEPFGVAADGSRYSKGIIDFAVLLDWERERYLAYECKRLNVVNKGSRSSLATAYVTQGMMRFLTEQYSEGLPVGCMLGYVLDGDVAFAQVQIGNAIASHPALSLLSGPTPLAVVHAIERFHTRHTTSTGLDIELRHALLSRISRT